MGLIPPAIFLGVAVFGIELIAVALALAAGALGVFGGVRTTVRLPPAAAMRPEAPADCRPSLLERLGLRRVLSQPARMVAREIGRRPLKAALTELGIAFACAILVVGNFGKDAIDHLVDFQFGISERDDARVQFAGAPPRSQSRLTRSESTGMPGRPWRFPVPLPVEATYHGSRCQSLRRCHQRAQTIARLGPLSRRRSVSGARAPSGMPSMGSTPVRTPKL